MKSKILGIDLSDNCTLLAYYSDERCWKVPTAVCRIKDSGKWAIGSSAYGYVLDGNGILTDKLLSLATKDASSTLEGTKYSAKELLKQFLKKCIEETLENPEDRYPTDIVISIPDVDKYTVKILYDAMLKLGYNPGHIHIISRSEAFIYYTMSQRNELHSNNVGLFSLDNQKLTYYEMKVQRKPKSTTVFAEKASLDESFNLDILDNPSGAKLADKILTSCGERFLKNKVFSSVMLTGKGFETQEWAPNFMKFICNRRKVFVDDEIFVRGAGFRGFDFVEAQSIFNFTCICDGRLECSIYIDINKKDRIMPYPIASIGDLWYDIERLIRVIPFNTKELELQVIPMEAKQRKVVRIPLDFLPARPSKTTMIEIRINFIDSRTMQIDIFDAGFGDLFPATDSHISREVRLWE